MDEYVWSNEDIKVLGVTIAHDEIVYKNYQPLIEKTKAIVNSWHNRSLSIIGKVKVVNTLIASLFVYKMMVLPIIPKSTIKKIDNIIRGYIWNGKKSKISYAALQNKKTEGGLNLINLHNKDVSLKATWPKILHKEKEYSTLVYTLMRCNEIKEDIWRCTLLAEDIKRMKIKSQFWEDVLICWNEFNFYKNKRIENQLIWYNSYIQVGNKVVMWNDVLRRGLKYVHQLFRYKEYKSDQQVWEEYGLTKLRFNSLKKAIPSTWKTFFLSDEKVLYTPLPPHNYDMCINEKSSLSKEVYEYIGSDISHIQHKHRKWVSEIGQNFVQDIMQFGREHVKVYSLTNVPKLRSFQYRLLQRSLVTNMQLYKWNLAESDQCQFCGVQSETVIHLMYSCDIVKQLWEQVKEYVRNRFNIESVISVENIILNNIARNSRVVNLICLLTKKFIYTQKCLKSDLNFAKLKGIIEYTERIEKCIAMKDNKMPVHIRKWKGIVDGTGNCNIDPSLNEYVELYLNDL